MRFLILLGRALRLRCPLCGRGQLFRRWLLMHESCPHCGVKFEREPGFFLGSIYINYGLTSLIVTVAYVVLLFGFGFPETPLLVAALAFVVLFPLLVFPWARSLWLGFDQWRDPRAGEIGTRQQPKSPADTANGA
jgi:uncharacterized protein (DUF983 family)